MLGLNTRTCTWCTKWLRVYPRCYTHNTLNLLSDGQHTDELSAVVVIVVMNYVSNSKPRPYVPTYLLYIGLACFKGC